VADPGNAIDDPTRDDNFVAVALPKLTVKIAPAGTADFDAPPGPREFFITQEPRMPTINARAAVTDLPPNTVVPVDFFWDTSVNYTAGRGTNWSSKKPQKVTGDTVLGSDYSPVFAEDPSRPDKTAVIRGGQLTLRVTSTVLGVAIEGQAQGAILATNP